MKKKNVDHETKKDENGDSYVTKKVIKDYTISEETPNEGEYWDIIDECGLYRDNTTGEYHSKIEKFKRVVVMGPSQKEGFYRVLGNGFDDIPRDKFYAQCK